MPAECMSVPSEGRITGASSGHFDSRNVTRGLDPRAHPLRKNEMETLCAKGWIAGSQGRLRPSSRAMPGNDQVLGRSDRNLLQPQVGWGVGPQAQGTAEDARVPNAT